MQTNNYVEHTMHLRASASGKKAAYFGMVSDTDWVELAQASLCGGNGAAVAIVELQDIPPDMWQEQGFAVVNGLAQLCAVVRQARNRQCARLLVLLPGCVQERAGRQLRLCAWALGGQAAYRIRYGIAGSKEVPAGTTGGGLALLLRIAQTRLSWRGRQKRGGPTQLP